MSDFNKDIINIVDKLLRMEYAVLERLLLEHLKKGHNPEELVICRQMDGFNIRFWIDTKRNLGIDKYANQNSLK